MTATVSPFLMFEGVTDQAIACYITLFPNSGIIAVEHYAAGESGLESKVRRADFTVAGLRLIAIDSPIKHAFGFTPSFSLFVDCGSAAEQEEAFRRLSEGGTVLMALADHGFSQRFGWVTDRFGVSWQLNLA